MFTIWDSKINENHKYSNSIHMKKIENVSEIVWPAILIQPQQNELVYLKSSSDWLIEAQQMIDVESRLLDTSGRSFQLCDLKKEQGDWEISDQEIKLDELIQRVKMHASLQGYCCSAKLGANNLPQVFDILRYLEDQN